MHTDSSRSTLSLPSGSQPLLRRLMAAGSLADRDVSALNLTDTRPVARNNDIYCEGDAMGDILFLVEGWAYRYRLLGDGRRQIVNFLIPGDLVGPITPTARQFAAALTDSVVYRVPRRDIANGMRDHPAFFAAIEALMAAEYEMLAERTVTLGRRNAKERMAHLLMELLDRLDGVGLVADDSFPLPLTQEMIGDALGLSVVHVNRTLRTLREEGLATVGFGRATIHNRKGLSRLAGTDDALHAPREEVTGLVALD